MEKLVFIVNPISGGKDKRKVLKTLGKGIDGSRFDWSVRMTEYAGHGREIARDCDADIVVAVGGDGTVSEVAQGVAGTKKHLGISRCPRKAIRQLNRSERTIMDYGTVEGRPFFCTTGVGMDAQVAWEFAKAGSRGLKTYVSKTLSVWRTFRPGHYRLEIDGAVHELDATFITVANVNQWGNNAVIAPEATVTDGLFDITVLRPFRIWDIPGLALRLFTRTFTRSGKVDTFRGKKIVLHRESAAPAHFDGDPIEMGTDIHIDIHPAAVRVLVPEGRSYKI